MNELTISCNLESPQEKNTKIAISIINNLEEDLLYKYMIGSNGTWDTLKDFSEESSAEWIPEEDGKYIIMIQGKRKDGDKSFDYVSRVDYIIGKSEGKLINSVSLDQYELRIGDKLNLFVDTDKVPLMFRYCLKVKDDWEIIKDYSADNTLSWVAKFEGKGELLVECKNIDSESNCDDFKIVEFEVLPLKEIEIISFKCLTSELVEDSELIFKVEASYEEGRNILYKFLRISSNGEVKCVQDYSTKKVVSYVETNSGDYKLLCLAKDMYSTNSFDTRAVINFKVKKYKELIIKSFTGDLSSPQLVDTPITLKADVIGGKELLYRYIVEGEYTEDSGYIRSNTYIWRGKVSGEYKIKLWAKDKSFEGNYEVEECFDFVIDEQSEEPVAINDVLIDKKDRVLVNEKIQVIVNASGGTDLRYSFIVSRNNEELDRIDYGTCNWMNFMPKEQGQYKLEIMVKDRYSDREYDCHELISIEVLDYIPASLDHVIFSLGEYHVVGDRINLNVITQNSKEVLVNYVLKINNHKVEETDFVKEKGYVFTPKCNGIYTVEIFAKSVKSNKPFDCKKEVKIEVHEAFPVTNTKVTCDKVKFSCNESITFTVHSEGGKDVVYEFYLMEKGDWNLVQNYSKKNYYTFIPFSKDEYKILVLAKSQQSKVSYEDYDTFAFLVE
ncbi:triple tyrosine motif-containing protein [Clostridium sp. CX1]|uniref:triple tyrosine motif-containing protein n=1 Tax=Clostridium sp. CX1 TaxID=2978346 RepID=UPI0021BFF0DE|nr:triple tyrosine motif-containing protein [Clostridium sp. CX1]MCT8976304.1 triple tyrosine motif-containing protein [Clostridium sp. CX1]